MAHLPLVSVIIPAFNVSKYIAKTAASVLEQTYKNIELIIVDDGSTDSTGAIVKSLFDQNIIYIYQENKGLPATRNTGIRASHGEFIAFLDADDFWHPTKIEKQVSVLLANPEIDVVYANFRWIDPTEHEVTANWNPRKFGKTLSEELHYHNIIAGSASSVMVRGKALQDVGLFDENLIFAEDLDMWRRLAYRHHFYRINEYLVYIRINPSGIQANLEKAEKGRLLYLEKVIATLPLEYASIKTKVTFLTYSEIFRLNLIKKDFSRAFHYYRKSSSLGLHYFFWINWAFLKMVFRYIFFHRR
jgi:glycosyltransferase involved in cell wall biosynthesis